MSPSWTATSRKPGDIPLEPIVLTGRSTPKVKEQLKAASEAAKKLSKTIEGDTLVSLSGFAPTKEESESEQIQIVVARVEES